MFHGKGGYTFEEVYNFPIWLRKFTFGKIKEFYKEEEKAAEEITNNPIPKNIPKPTKLPPMKGKAKY